jgi:hypothetical protein
MLLFGEEDIEMSAQAFDATYFFTSAKTGEHVQLVFQRLAEDIVRRNLPTDLIKVEP